MKIIQEEVEDKIIDWIIRNTGDRLIIIKPEEEIKGVDLIVKKKGEYKSCESQASRTNQQIVKARAFGVSRKKKTKEILINVNWQVKRGSNCSLPKEINLDLDNFCAIENFYLMFVFFDAIKQDIDDSLYFIPAREFKNNDKSKFLIKKKDLGRVLLDIILK